MQSKRILFTMISFLVILCTIHGATIYVPDDYSAIQDAIFWANAGDTVIVRPGTYYENIDFKGQTIIVISEDGPETTVIDGRNEGSVVSFKNSEGPDSVLEGFTLTNGSGNGPGPTGNVYGGGIYCTEASPTVVNNIITGNKSYEGGGIFCFHPPDLKIIRNTIIYNTANFGGGIACLNCSPEISDNTISWNTANIEGGGVLCSYNCSPVVDNNIVRGNSTVRFGGGLEFWNSCSPIITNNLVMNNTVSLYGGGGITMSTNCSGIITNNTISGNSANGSGGGLYFESDSITTITINTIVNNAADCGGGIYIKDSTPLIANNVISGNDAVAIGGAICAYLRASTTIINNLITGNSADRGGGINCGFDLEINMMNNTFYKNTAISMGGAIRCNNNSSVNITDTIIWNNDAPTGSEIWLGKTDNPSSLTIGYSDVDGGQASVYVESGCTINWGPGMIDADPCFVSGSNGFCYLGQVATGQPVNSPCVDTGSDLASNLGMEAYWTRTDEAPDSGIVDMGYHYGPFLYPALQTDVFSIPENTGGTVNFLLLAGSNNALRNYLLVGGLSGTVPGLPLPGGLATLPVNWDLFSDLEMTLLNTPVFSNFMGNLDTNGMSTAQLNLPPITGFAGVTMYYAYCCNNPFDYVSNALSIQIVP